MLLTHSSSHPCLLSLSAHAYFTHPLLFLTRLPNWSPCPDSLQANLTRRARIICSKSSSNDISALLEGSHRLPCEICRAGFLGLETTRSHRSLLLSLIQYSAITLLKFYQGALCFHFALGPTNLGAGPGGKKSVSLHSQLCTV